MMRTYYTRPMKPTQRLLVLQNARNVAQTDSEKDLLSRAAERQGLPVSAFLRMAALDRAREVLGKAAAGGARRSSPTRTRRAAPRRKDARKGARR